MKSQSSPETGNVESTGQTTANGEERAFTPSWIDRFTTWVDRLSWPAWLFYTVLGIALILVQMLFLWLESGLAANEILPVVIFNGFAVPFLLALIHFLDKQTMTAMNTMQPVLDMSGSEFDQYEYKLSNMPFLAPLVAGLLLTAVTILSPLVAIEPVRYEALEQLPIFTVVFHIIDKSSAFLMGVFLYHTIRQLRLVNSINSNYVRINLFHLRPLQAFSRFTAATAVGLVVFVYAWMLINPELLRDPVIIGYLVILTILAILVFVWPLYGVHRLMQIEKESALTEIDLRLEAIYKQFNHHFREGDFAEIERLNGIISSLETQHQRVSDLPTWPWRSETARFALTAIALPLILMILQFFVLQALDR